MPDKVIFVRHKTAWRKWDDYRRMLACEAAHEILTKLAIWSNVRRGKTTWDPRYLEVQRLLCEMREDFKARVPFPRRWLRREK